VTSAGGNNGVVQRGSITDNVFDLQADGSGKGIVLNPGSTRGVREVLVSGNTLSNVGAGIQIGAHAFHIFLSENAFEAATVPQPVSNAGEESRGAFFPDRVGVGRINDVTNGLTPTVKETYAYSDQAARPRVYLEGLAGTSSPGIDFAFDHSNTRRAAIVATAPAGQNNLGVQLELFTKPDSGAGIKQRAILDAAGNLVWTSANYQEMIELGADPAAPAANKARLFLRDNGSGKTQLCVRFATGAVVVLATQP